MLRLTLAQMRRSIGRLAAAGIAIMIGAAFVAATLLSGEVLTRTTYDAAASQYGDADLVITQATLADSDLAALAAVDGVQAVQPLDTGGADLTGPGGHAWVTVAGRADDPRLDAVSATDGSLPAADDEIALPERVADQLGVGIGDQVQSTVQSWAADATQPTDHLSTLRVVGLVDAPSAFLSDGGVAVVTKSVAHDWLALSWGGQDVTYWSASVTLAPGTSTADATTRISQLLDGTGTLVRTRDEQAAANAAELSGSTWALTGVVLGFAAVALLVASLVIANTFQVLVAQRTRTLALLRCVGAERRQLQRGVLIEATLLGLATSAAGVLLGIGLVQATLTVLGDTTDVPLPSTITMTPAVVLVPLLVGTLVTVLASLAPARAATRVAPLAALRPADTSVHQRSGRVRAWLAGVLVVVGAGGLALGMAVATAMSMPLGLVVGMLGGTLSFVGVMVGAVFWVPGLLARLGRLGGRSAAARLAAANAVRNPRRVATTSGALFIGVTLVAMMSTGAASVTRTFTSELNSHYPVDVVLESVAMDSDGNPALPSDLVDEVSAVDGVAASAVVQQAVGLTVTGPDGDQTSVDVYAGDATALAGVLNDADQAAALGDGTILLGESDAASLGVGVGDRVPVTGPDGVLDLEVTATDSAMAMVTTSTLAGLDHGAPASDLWLALAPGADPTSAVTDIQDITGAETDVVVQVIGLAVERAFFQRVVDTLLAVVVGLLGVAVVIAMVGVTNTLSLSVLERRRESATLRAIGMTRAQLRSSLAIEGLLVALVGTLVGALLGIVYGWIGAQILLSEVTSVALAVPWRDLGLVLLVAVAAGLLASVLPARSATRTPPVEALASE
ncbi:FtsX-like permease family protein [Actinotalea sp. M2MS4P-6]|uniref:ABC transporter permease n=1 Tax=Actinotalea sp. M2MS4P-6 TaxID=2983762 RepID=UPI0021E4A422|nr:FtsX-like permease family protein [Actinotalea sp. M2MS4P-6]MCV2395847.1 FtsX-like permease family protein [Actinotalea sp. M2MS4P-6]